MKVSNGLSVMIKAEAPVIHFTDDVLHPELLHLPLDEAVVYF